MRFICLSIIIFLVGCSQTKEVPQDKVENEQNISTHKEAIAAQPEQNDDLFVTPTADSNAVDVGDTVEFKIVYGNRGKKPIDEVIITQEIDTKVFEIIDAGGGLQLSAGKIEYNVGTLEPGGGGIVEFKLRTMEAVSGEVANYTRISGKYRPQMRIEVIPQK